MAATENQKRPATRPLPDLRELDTVEFWRGTKAGEFRYQQCDNCATIIWYPRGHCTGCTDSALQWQVSKGHGTVYSFSIVRQSYHPFFRNQVPYAVVLIDLDEGPRFLTNMVGISDPGADISIGQRVEVQWEEHDSVNVPLVKPIDSE